MTENRIDIGGDYLMIAPCPNGPGYVHQLSERAFIVDNIEAFQNNNPLVNKHDITIYELKEINHAVHRGD